MSLSPQDWHRRFSQQALWTQDLRQHLYSQAGVEQAARILEVGCGTGALHKELVLMGVGGLHGLDINPHFLAEASTHSPSGVYIQGDGHAIPYAKASFDLSLCHFLLLWVGDPRRVLSEMRRVTRPGGALLVLAEPDYGGRIDYPPELAPLGRLQADSLRTQGAEPEMGRRLASLISGVGLDRIETGVLGAQWGSHTPANEIESEWFMLRHDVGDKLSQEQLDHLQKIEARAWKRGARVLFVPTFYAWGIVPE